MPARFSRALGARAISVAGLIAAAATAGADFKVLPGAREAGGAAPAGRAAPAAGGVEDAKVTRLLDFLEKEYGILLTKNKDRVARSLVAICVNRLPRNGPTRTLLELAKKESDPLVRAVAWECLVSRASLLGMDQYGQLMDVTATLAQADVLRGKLRVAALDLLAVSPPTKQNKALLVQLFAKCDSRQPADDEVIDGVGRCVAAWRSADLVEYFIGRLSNIDEVFRAYRVLSVAGSPVGVDRVQTDLGDRKFMAALQADHVAWWNSAKGDWTENKVSLEDSPWRALQPHLVGPPVALASINADDKVWKRDLELRRPTLKSFDVAFVVDVTGSMDPALAWLKRDVRAMMNGLGVVSMEPRIGVTFYRDRGDDFLTRVVPLTANAGLLLGALEKMDCKGGGDVEEAVLEGVGEALKANPWNTSATGRKVLVLVADAPGHAADQKAAEALVAAAAEKGFRLHAVKLQSPSAPADQAGLDGMAKAGKGIALPAGAREIADAQPRKKPTDGLGRARPMIPAAPVAGAAPEPAGGLGLGGGLRLGGSATDAPLRTAPLGTDASRDPAEPFFPAPGPVGRRVLTTILVDAINPQYADRVEPMAAVLWELLQEPSFEKQPPFGPVVKVDTEHMRNNTAAMRNDSKIKPKGVQDR